MSIYRQLWLAIIGLTVLAFAGSFSISVYTARNYIEQQLYMKNVDNASSLAKVLSQLPSKDPVTVGLFISAQFDMGHYQEIILTDPEHKTLVEKHYTGSETGAPDWFEHLFPIRAEAGEALVQDGWKQYGTIHVLSQSSFAYQALWTGVKELTTWFLLAGVAAGALGTLLLRLLFQPLKRVVEQAQAIQERRFISVDEPATPELRAVVVAMNAMVERLKGMFAEEASRLDELRRQANHDPLTNLPNRAFFMTWLQETLQSSEAPASGSLALIRIADLEALNTRLGHLKTDQLIKDIAAGMRELVGRSENRIAARLNGSDFALLAAGDDDAALLAEQIQAELARSVLAKWPDQPEIFHVGTVPYRKTEQAGELLATTDKALAIAENKGPNSSHSLDGASGASRGLSSDAWRQTLTGALNDGRIRLERYPVLAAGGQALHQEGTARLQLEPNGPWLSAGEFMPMALRLKLSATVDMDALQIALNLLASGDSDIAVNLSADSIVDWSFRDAMIDILRQNPERSRRLWIEVPEYGAFRHFDAFRSFCLQLEPLGCKLGIEHFGQQFGEIAKLAELGLDYLKVDSSYVRDIEQNAGNREFLKGLCKMARNFGMLVIAEGVLTEAELSTLVGLGFDGLTGQAVTRRAQG
jgi:diguanylate cyclase (GGDEF)-like protein